MTLLGRIFRPWDLTSNETFVPKPHENRADGLQRESVENDNVDEFSFKDAKRRRENVSTDRPKSLRNAGENSGDASCTRSGEESVDSQPRTASSLNCVRSEDTSSTMVSHHPHFLEINNSNVPYYLPNSPVGTPTTPNFMNAPSINELASLTRTELTVMGLLPPEPPASMKVKRQRPKRFRCPHCQVAFSNNGQLRGHIRIHTGERPFACEHEGCGKSFTRNEELTRHRRIHTGLRPYPCTHCGKKFGRKDHLKKHTRTHQRPMFAASSGMIGLGNPFHPFNPSLIPPHSAINEFASPSSPYALPFMLSIPPPISHFPFS